MSGKKRLEHKSLSGGCGLLALIVTVGLVVVAGLIASRERHAARFPGSAVIPSVTNYTAKPTYIRLDNGYRSQAPLSEIRNWYADRFRLTITEEGDECVGLGGTTKGLALQRLTSVTICDESNGRVIWITRLISRR